MKQIIPFLIALYTLATSAQEQIFVTSGTQLLMREANHCNTTLVGEMGRSFLDIALTPNGNLYGSSGTQLFQINTTNGSTVLIGSYSPAADNVNALESLDNNTLVCELGQSLYKINISDATIAPIGFIDYEAHGDIAWYDNNLYMTAQPGKLLRLTLNEDNTALISVVVVNPNTTIPNCEGLITVQHEDFIENVLLGFSAFTTYEICPIDGSFTNRCYGDYIPGAAATRLPAQTPLLTECPVELGIAAIGDADVFSMTPNPANQQDQLQIHSGRNFSGPITLKLLTLQGQLLLQQTAFISRGNPLSLDLGGSYLTTGIYLLEFSGNGIQSSSRLVIR